MAKCQHLQVESHYYGQSLGKGVRCVACHAVMMANASAISTLAIIWITH